MGTLDNQNNDAETAPNPDQPVDTSALPPEVLADLQGLIRAMHENPSRAVAAKLETSPTPVPRAHKGKLSKPSATSPANNESGLAESGQIERVDKGAPLVAQSAFSSQVANEALSSVAPTDSPNSGAAKTGEPGWLALNWPFVLSGIFILIGLVLVVLTVTS